MTSLKLEIFSITARVCIFNRRSNTLLTGFFFIIDGFELSSHYMSCMLHTTSREDGASRYHGWMRN